MFKAHALFISITLYLLFNQRIFLKLSSGGRGIAPVLEIFVPVAIIAWMLVLERNDSSIMRLNTRRFRMLWAPYLTLTILLPIAGVLYGDYPFRTVLTALTGVRGVCFVVCGCWIANAGPAVTRLAVRYVFAAIVLECLFATGQYLHNQGVPLALLETQYRWDLGSQAAYSDHYIITGRSVGSFINPNELGYWSVVAFWFSALMFRGWSAAVGVGAALSTLLFSQSRGSMFALLGSASLFGVYLCLTGPKLSRTVRDWLITGALGSVLLATIGVAALQDRIVHSPVLTRFSRGIQVISEGAGADRNAEGRVMAWEKALVFYTDHMAGTWGEPQYLFGHFMDNDYVRVLLQGSPVYLASLLLALGAGICCIGQMGRLGHFVAMSMAVIAVNAMTANPLAYSATGITWTMLGYYLRMRQTELPAMLVRSYRPAPIAAAHSA